MDRRIFISSVARGALVAALPATAQVTPNPNRPRRIGWLQGGVPDTLQEQQEVNDALAGFGWIVGQNVLIDRRYVLKDEDLPRTAEEFIRANVDLIITSGTPATMAAKNGTTSIPILMWNAADPVSTGLVSSLARPGGNITGYAMLSPEMAVKRLSLLRELLPGIRRVAELDDFTNPGARVVRKHLEEAYRSVGVEPIFVDFAEIKTFDGLLAELVRRRAQALTISDVPVSERSRAHFNAAIRASLVTIVDRYELLEAGALLSFESDQTDFLRRNAALFDKLLRGAKPADLPVEQPTKFSLGINLRTAKSLGVTIPQTLLLRADRVIQ